MTTEATEATHEEENGLRDRIKRMEEVDIDRIRDFAGGNPKDRTAEDRAMLDASLDRNGYAMPVLVREDGDFFENLDGHGRIERIREKYPEVKKLKVIVLDVESAAEGKRLILGLKNTAAWNRQELDEWVREGLEDGLTADDVIEMTGFTAADLESLADAGREILDNLPKNEPSSDADPSPAGGSDARDEEEARNLSAAERATRIFVFSKSQLAEMCFAHYRKAGFPFPDPSPAECMLAINRLASMSTDQLVRTHEGGPVADKFQPHRFEAEADGMISPMEAFLDDKKLRYVIDMIIDSTGTLGDGTLRSMLGMVQGAQSCSNFRPGFAAYLYRRFVPPGGTVLDTSAGFGGRLVGAIASTVVGRYIGIDPNKPSIEGSRKLLALLGKADFAEFAVQPAEDIEIDRWADECDFMFTSPPYFNKERYSKDANQSGNRYPDADQWREEFLVPMLKLTFASLKPGAHAGINIADSLVGGIRHPLGDWTVTAGKRAGFEHVGVLEFPIGGSRNFGAMKGTQKQEEGGAEPIFLFRKPSDAPPSKKERKAPKKAPPPPKKKTK